MNFCSKRLVTVPSSNPDIQRYVYGLHSVIMVGDIISFSSFGEGELPQEMKLSICRHLGAEQPVYLGSSPAEAKAEEVA